MCRISIPQEDADHILAVGHKVRYQNQDCVITGIRVWHDLGTYLGPPWRGKPVFDLQGEGWSATNIPLDELDLWFEMPPMPIVSGYTSQEVKEGDKGHERVKQSRAGPATEESGKADADQEH